jgi:hypothetical protein
MPKSDKPFPAPNRKNAPAGLLAVADLIERIPGRAEDVLIHETGRRERELILMQETRRLLSWHPWHTIRFLLLSGAVAFAAAWLVSFLSALARFYTSAFGSPGAAHAAGGAGSAIGGAGIPFLNEWLAEIGKIIPASAFALFSKIPDFGAIESFFVALGVVMLVAFVKLLFILLNWKKIKLLNEAERELSEELETLNRWKGKV